MPRGGKRQGTPGKGYANRTDLGTNYDNATSAATGGVEPPVDTASYPQDTPNLTDPTNRPDEPITAGLNVGEGKGPDDPRGMETAGLKRWLPIIEPLLDQPDTPNSVRALVRYIRGS